MAGGSVGDGGGWVGVSDGRAGGSVGVVAAAVGWSGAESGVQAPREAASKTVKIPVIKGSIRRWVDFGDNFILHIEVMLYSGDWLLSTHMKLMYC